MAQTSAKAAKLNVFQRFRRYFNDVRAEMGRVVWPSRTEVINSSGIVLSTLVVFIVLIFAFDYVSAQIITLLSGIGG